MLPININDVFNSLAELYCNSDTQKKEYIEKLEYVYNEYTNDNEYN